MSGKVKKILNAIELFQAFLIPLIIASILIWGGLPKFQYFKLGLVIVCLIVTFLLTLISSMILNAFKSETKSFENDVC